MSEAGSVGTTCGEQHAWPVKRYCFHSPKSGRGSEYLGGQEGQGGHEVAAVVNKVKSRGIPVAVALRKATEETTKLVGRNKGRPWAVETQLGPHKWYEEDRISSTTRA